MSATLNFGLQQFLCKSIPPAELRDSWKRWLRGLQNVLAAAKVTDPCEKKSHLLALGGFELQDIFYNIPDADVSLSDGIDPFEVAIEKLNCYFAPKHHEAFERYVFWSLVPDADEPIENFLLRAQDQANKCTFGNTEEESRHISIIDKTVLWAPSELREKLLQKKNLTLDILTKTVNSHQAVKYQASQMSSSKKEVDVHKLYNRQSSTQGKHRNMSNTFCSRCGRNGHDWNDQNCPARNAKCNKCGNVGHFLRKCRTKDNRKRSYNFTSGSNEDGPVSK